MDPNFRRYSGEQRVWLNRCRDCRHYHSGCCFALDHSLPFVEVPTLYSLANCAHPQRYMATSVRTTTVRVIGELWTKKSASSTGEPLWAETARMCCRIFLMFIFALCLAFIIRQAVTSPNVTERIINPVAQVEVPGNAEFTITMAVIVPW